MSWWLSLDEEKKLYEEKQKYRVICHIEQTKKYVRGAIITYLKIQKMNLNTN